MNTHAAEGDVLVAVADPDHVQQLVRTASALTDGTVRLVTVVVKPHDSPFGLFSDDTIRRDFAGDSRDLLARADPPAGVSVERDLVVGRSVADGLLAAVAEYDSNALIVGWQGGSRTDSILGSTVDRLVERAACDLYVERVGRTADGVDSVLLPVPGGPHVQPAARMAGSLAAHYDATVRILSVATPDADDPGRHVDEAKAAVTAAAPVPVETSVEPGPSAVEAIVEAAADADAVVLGATRRGALRRRLVGSVPQRVVDRTDTAVILARSKSVVGGPLGRLGAVLRG